MLLQEEPSVPKCRMNHRRKIFTAGEVASRKNANSTDVAAVISREGGEASNSVGDLSNQVLGKYV